MKYAFNPKSRQINPVLEMTLIDPTLRGTVISGELYALVCKGKVSLEDIAAMFAVGKSPEILLKNHAAVKESPIAKAPAATITLPPVGNEPKEGDKDDEGNADANGAFDGKALCGKKTPELLVIATIINCPELADPNFAPTRQNLIKAIMAKAAAAEAPKTEAPAAPAVLPAE